MSSVQDLFGDVLKQHHYSLTKVRQAVFASLGDHEAGPLTMQQLVARTKGVDRASIYRAVALFETLGIVQRVNIGWKYKLELSDLFAGHHHHLTCLQCKRTVELSEDALEKVISQLGQQHGFTAVSHQMEVQGYCRNCQAQQLAAGHAS